MKKLITIFFLLTCLVSRGQNLVPNPSFELIDSCPTTYGQMTLQSWTSYRASTDYFNSCNNNVVGVPFNFGGFQHAFDKIAYCGILTYFPFTLNYREYIGCKLTAQLIVGQKYYFHMKVNLADSARYSTDKIGLQLSSYPYFQQNTSPISNHAIVYSNINIIDAAFIADSAYQYMVIGNFFDDAHITITDLGTGNHSYFGDGAYYYIDMVCLSTDSLTCNATTNGITTIKQNNVINAFPNPFSANLTFTNPNTGRTTINLYDIFLRRVLQTTFTNSTTLNTAQLRDGIYFYEISDDNNKVISKGKVIKR